VLIFSIIFQKNHAHAFIKIYIILSSHNKQIKTLSSGSRDDAECGNKMISLVIFGEYDDMKGLVRDGAKRLKENQNALDEALWALNK